MKNYDIIVVGASTTGSWFAKNMALKGHSVLMLEKQEQENVSRDYDIFHMGKKDMEKFGLTIPQPGDADYGFIFNSGRSYSPYGNYIKQGEGETVVGMHKHEYIMRMNKEAQSAGAEIIYGAAFTDFIKDEKGKIIGVKYTDKEGENQAFCQIVADCSGIPSVARRKLPDNAYVENFTITPADIFYVVLYYAKYVNADVKPLDLHGFFMQYKSWSAPSGDDHGAILGIGANFSYEYAEEIFKDFKKNVSWPEYTVDRIEKGMTPYHRTLYSFVDDGFIAMGDTACLTKPTCGEGCTSSLYQAEIAVEVISSLLSSGKALTKENMWSVNSRYVKVQGKAFDTLRPLLIGIVSFSYSEAEYLFSKDVLFSKKILCSMGEDLVFTAGDIAKIVSGIAAGVIKGKLKVANVRKTVNGLMQSIELGKLYDEYPETPAGYFTWKAKADALWSKIGKLSDSCDPELLRKLNIK